MAAVDYVQGKRQQQPPILAFVNYTNMWGSPYPGGWLDWPAGLVTKMAVVTNYTKAVQLYDTHSRTKGWTNANPEIFKLVTDVWDWRKELGYSNWA